MPETKPRSGSGSGCVWAVVIVVVVLFGLKSCGRQGTTGASMPPSGGYAMPPQTYPQQMPTGGAHEAPPTQAYPTTPPQPTAGSASIVDIAKGTLDQDLRLSETARRGGRFEVISIYETGDPTGPVACVIRFYAPPDRDFAWLYHDSTYLYDGTTRAWVPRNVRDVTTFKDGRQE